MTELRNLIKRLESTFNHSEERISDLETEHLKFIGAKRKKRMKNNEEKPMELIGHNQTKQ